MDFELSEAERAFEAELERFLEQYASPEVMDRHPEQLSQTVDTPAKRAFMRELAAHGWLGMSWPRAYGGAERPGIYDFVLTEALSRHRHLGVERLADALLGDLTLSDGPCDDVALLIARL